jgi:hypothetical protein
MSKYKILLTGHIQREDGAVIPCDLNNRDYREYLEWTESGGVADVEVAPFLGNEEKRRAEYIKRCDPLLAVIQGYELELSIKQDSTTQAKLNAAKSLWIEYRNKIRQDFP